MSTPFIDGKSRRVRMPGWPIGGKPVRRLVGMIYWYGWGDDRDFDIREVRKALGLPEDSKHDKWFMAEKSNACSAFQALMIEMEEALAGRDFGTLLDEIDEIAEKQWRQEQQEREAALPKPYSIKPGTEDWPF